jgi:hypothetical protein
VTGDALGGSPYDDDVHDACAEHVFVRGHRYVFLSEGPTILLSQRM